MSGFLAEIRPELLTLESAKRTHPEVAPDLIGVLGARLAPRGIAVEESIGLILEPELHREEAKEVLLDLQWMLPQEASDEASEGDRPDRAACSRTCSER